MTFDHMNHSTRKLVLAVDNNAELTRQIKDQATRLYKDSDKRHSEYRSVCCISAWPGGIPCLTEIWKKDSPQFDWELACEHWDEKYVPLKCKFCELVIVGDDRYQRCHSEPNNNMHRSLK